MNQHQKILKHLWDGQPHYTHEIVGLGIFQYNARIKELRDRGLTILAENDSRGFNRFRLVTPTNLIDYDKAELKKTENQEELF